MNYFLPFVSLRYFAPLQETVLISIKPCQNIAFSNSTFSRTALSAAIHSPCFRKPREYTDEQMMKIAREMNLSETVFVLKPESDEVLRRLRIFTPTREIPFAGHPIVGTWTALAREGVVAGS